jgi:TRAP-type mannitol/chloroaromatic compound transport system substrate-binding protein
VARFNYFPGWHQPFTAFHLVVGDAAWAALDPAARASVETACTAATLRNLARAEALQGAVLRDFEQRGVSTLLLPDDVLADLERASDTLLSEEAAANADFGRVLESQRSFSADYARWRRIAYLRRR